MTNSEINDLTNKTTPVSTDEVEIQETAGGLSKKATLGNLSKAIDLDNVSSGTTNKVYTASEQSKLAGIEASADVTDATNVTAAGALMDSEVTNLAQVKAFDSSDYATSAQGALADSATQPGDLIINVKDYGATGDGTTDDTTAILAAIADLRVFPRAASDVSLLYFPDGEYLVSDTLLFSACRYVQIVGSGTITANMNKPIIRIASTLWLHINGINLEQSNTGSLSGCLEIEDSYIMTFSRMYMTGGDKTVNVVYGNNLIFNDCSMRAGRITFYTTSRGNNTANVLRGCAIEKGTEWTLYLGYTSNAYGNWLFDGCYFEGQATAGDVIYITNGFNADFRNCYINNLTTGRYCVVLDGTLATMNCRFSKCIFNSSAGAGYAFRQLTSSIKKGAILDRSNTLETNVTAYNTSDTYIPALVTDKPRDLNVYNLEWLLESSGTIIDWTHSSTPPSYTFTTPMSDRGENTIQITAQYIYKTIYLKKDVTYEFIVTAKNSGAGSARMDLFTSGLAGSVTNVSTTSTSATQISFVHRPTASANFELLLRNISTTTASFSGCHIKSYESEMHI